jgi:hypothetical protein
MADEPTTYPEVYLGDGVYATFDGYQIWLDTRAEFPVQRIALCPGTFSELLAYRERLGALLGPPGT